MKQRVVYIIIVMLLSVNGARSTDDKATFSAGFTANLFSDVNKADAVASIKVWVDTILTQRGIGLASAPAVYSNASEMKANLLAGEADFVSMVSTEFFEVEQEVELKHFHYTSLNGKITEQYLLLVRRDGPVEGLSDLQGKSLSFVEGARLDLSMIWLETLLLEDERANLDRFFGNRISHEKTSRTVLSVFFGKVDACLVTRGGYETMVELNPQIGKRLKPLQTSPDFIPALLAIRKGFDEHLTNEIVAGLHALDTSVRGKQILTVFRADKLVEGSIKDLALTRQWVEKHALLVGEHDALNNKAGEAGE